MALWPWAEGGWGCGETDKVSSGAEAEQVLPGQEGEASPGSTDPPPHALL